jgi:hypothetical protein
MINLGDLGEGEKMTKRKLLKIASLWLTLGLVLSLVMMVLPMASPAEAG